MKIRVALVGNPNCGKTTLFNELTGSSQYVGNWPGVTVEKKEGTYTGDAEVVFTDLPGVYSLSPYSPEEVVTRDYLLSGEPDVVVNLVDATNLERNLYLTTQIIDTGIPVVIALNMMDVVEKEGTAINRERLSKDLGCPIIPISALRGRGIEDLVEATKHSAASQVVPQPRLKLSSHTEETLKSIELLIKDTVPHEAIRWHAIKLFEDEDLTESKLNLPKQARASLDAIRSTTEQMLDDDAESIIASERYDMIEQAITASMQKSKTSTDTTAKIDRVLTNRWLGLPIFIIIMTFVYFIAVSTVGAFATEWLENGVFGEGWLYSGGAEYEQALETWEEGGRISQEPDPATFGTWVSGIPVVLGGWLEQLGTADWLQSLILDGVVAGVGAVLTFVPQMIVLFLLLSFLEGCGYMARVAFLMDRIFRKFGLSGKSFIPMLIASGCAVPAIMATKTIENERDRRMTIMTTSFIPCGAKLPIIALVFGAIAGGDPGTTWWIAPLFYFLGVFAVIMSGIMLRKTRMFRGPATPFVMELPQYHVPTIKNLLLHTWERVRSFIVRAGTVIFVASIVIWFLLSFGWYEGSFGLLNPEQPGYISHSLMAAIGNGFAWIFTPLGFGNWESAVTTLTGLAAKENVVSTLAIITNLGEAAEGDASMWTAFGTLLNKSTPAILAFCAFNLLCAPCIAAIGTIRRQMQSAKWMWFAIGYQTLLAWVIALMIYQFGSVLSGALAFNVWTGVASVFLLLIAFQVFRPMPKHKEEEVCCL